MPINRYQIRNEYSLSDPELYKIAGKDDPEALLEGVAMSGLVGVLRQLGDLAQFAAEIFHNLHEEVMSTAARGHSLIVRVQQLEAEFPSVEKTLLLQTSQTAFLYNSGMDWHPNLRMDQNLVTQQDLPRFVRDSYEECRGPPRLFLLDKFDVAGAGASLKRYTDPSFFKEAPSSTNRKSDEQRERRIRKVKKRGLRWRNGDTPLTYPSSHAKLHQLFLEENIETGGTPEETERRVKLKNRQFPGSLPDQNRGRSYMEKILNAGSQKQKAVDENCVDALALTWPSENGCEYGHDIVENNTISLKESAQTDQNASSLLNNMDMMVVSSIDDFGKQKSDEIFAIEAEGVGGYDHGNGACKIPSTTSKIVLDEESDDGQRQSEIGVDDGHNSDGYTSEINNYLDALAAIDYEIETDSEDKSPHYSNQKSVLEDSDTSEGKRKLLSNDAQLNDNVIISEDDSTSFKGKDSSSCSVSVDALAETTIEHDASVMSVPSIPNFNPDLVKTPVDDHSMTEEIPGNEPENHVDRSTIVEVNGSSEIGLSEEYVPVDVDASLQKICFVNEDSDEMYTDAAKPNLTSRIGEGDANEAAPWSCDGQVADGAEETHRGHWSHGEKSMLDTVGGHSSVYPDSFPDLTLTHDGSVDLLLEASARPDSNGSSAEEYSNVPAGSDVAGILGTELSLNNPFISDSTHPETVGLIGLASNMETCFTSSKELSENYSSAPSFTHCLNFQEQISETVNSGHAPQPDAAAESGHSSPEVVIKEVIADDKNEKEAQSTSFSETIDTDETNIASVGSPVDEDIRGNSILTGNLTPLLDFSEAREHRHQSSEETDVNYDGTPIYSDPVATVSDSDKSLNVLQSDATNDHGHVDNHDNEAVPPDDFLSNIPSKLPSNSTYVLPDFHHDVAKVEVIAIGADDSRQDDENFQHDNGTLLHSSSSLNPEEVQQHVSGKKECHQNGERSSLRQTPELEALKCVDSLQDTPENLNSSLCNLSSDSLTKHLQNNGKSVVEAPSTSESNALNIELSPMNGLNLLDDESAVKPLGAVELSSQSLHYSQQIQTSHNSHALPSVSRLPPQHEHTECSSQSIIKPSPNFLGHDTLNGHNRATQGVDNSGKPVYPLGFPTLGMLQTEPEINLNAPPLPPLPPMQWRLSRFQNSSAAPEKHMLQHTLDLSQQNYATVSEQSSQDEKYGIGEENLSNTAVSMSVRSQNGTQLSENGYVAQQGAITLPMLQSTSLAPEGQVLLHTIDLLLPTPTTVLEVPSPGNMKEFRSEDNLSSTIPISVRCHIGTQDPANGYVGFSENNMSEVKRDVLLSIPPSTYYPNGNQTSQRSYLPCGNLHESTSLDEDHSCGNSQIVAEAKVAVEVGSQDEHLKHISQDNEGEVVNTDFQFLAPSSSQPSADLVSPEADRTNDGVQTNADANTSETLQKKPPRPRNPLIDEVVAIDKSKLRKVERAKLSLELKPGGDLLLEQMQLKKVERVEPPVEGNAGDGEFPMERVQLRKAGERVIPEVEQNPDETKSPRVQLRKVPKRANTLLGSKSMGRDSLLEQIRTKSFNLKSAVVPRPNLQGPSVQGPRANLKVAAILEKASNIRQAMVGSDEEDDGDSWSDC